MTIKNRLNILWSEILKNDTGPNKFSPTNFEIHDSALLISSKKLQVKKNTYISKYENNFFLIG